MHPYTDVLLIRGRHIADWLLTQIDGEGSLLHATDMYAYTKCVYALTVSGHPDRASLVLNQILKRFGTADGDLMLNAQAGKKTCEPYTSFFSQTYSNSWVILGAEKLGRLDVVKKLNQCLLDSFYDPEMGAMRCSRRPLKDRYDTCGAATGILCLLNSRPDIAEKLGEFLIQVERQQPDRKNIFYSNIEKPFCYSTEFHPQYPGFTGVKTGEPGQAVWMIGYPIASLAKLYELTGKEVYLDGAMKYADAFLHAGEHAYVSAGCGKALWGFSILFRLTGDKRYDKACRRILDYFFTQQAPDGSFPIPGFVPEGDMLGYSVIFDTTPEYCRWFFEVAAELNGAH